MRDHRVHVGLSSEEVAAVTFALMLTREQLNPELQEHVPIMKTLDETVSSHGGNVSQAHLNLQSHITALSDRFYTICQEWCPTP